MSGLQNLTDDFNPTPEQVAEVNLKILSDSQQSWIDYRALNGLIFDPTRSDATGDTLIRKMTIQEFADTIGVTRQTLYDWQSSIPDFWGKVNARRIELSGQSRLAKLHEVWYLKALAMKDWRIADAYLRNFDPNYIEPRQKVEHELGNSWAALLDAKRKRDAVEGEVVGDGTTNPNR